MSLTVRDLFAGAGGSSTGAVSVPGVVIESALNHWQRIAAAEAQVDDCLFRMLEPSEVAAGMAFPSDYVWKGTRRERVQMTGNAVTPPAARDIVAAVAEALA